MAWITLTIDSLKTALSQPELDALPEVARNLDYEPEEYLESAIKIVVGDIHGRVGVKNQVGPEGTIPSELELAAVALVRREIFGRVPGVEFLYNKVRQDQTTAAEKKLEAVARGLIAIVPPTVPAPEQPGNFGLQVVQSRPPLGGMGGL